MNCLRIDQIYLYLESELSPEDYPPIRAHLSSCEKCRRAVDERKRFLEASRCLPEWEIPPDFTQRVLGYIFPKKIALRDWIITWSIGLTSAVLAFFAVYLASGQNMADVLVNLNRTALNLFQNIIILAVKAAKLISVGIQVLVKIISLIITGLGSLSTVLGPEIQIGMIALTLILTALLIYGAKRKLLSGEKA